MNSTPIVDAVRQSLMQAGLWRDHAVLLACVSGGADSVALLYALCDLRSQKSLTVLACHVQHALRGESSFEDERFVRALCQRLQVPLSVVNANLTGGMADAGAETRARDCRRRIFSQQLHLLHADALLLAHHRNDQAETVLMHLLRGAGMQGLCGMQAIAPFAGGQLLRPFLALPKQALLNALAAEQLPHREDESNQLAQTPRNALRLHCLPALEALFPQADKHLAQAAQTLSVDEACLTQQADALYEQALLHHAPIFALSSSVLLCAHEALVRRVLRRWFMEGLALCGLVPHERGLCESDTLALLALLHAKSGATLNLPCGLKAVAGAAHLHLQHQSGEPLEPLPPTPPLPLALCKQRYEIAGLVLRFAPLLPSDTLPQNARSILLTPEWLALSPQLRMPMAEDCIHPFGAAGSKPLRRHLTDLKVDPAFRPALPVLAVGSRILWIPTLTSAEELRCGAMAEGGEGCYRLWVEGDVGYL
ncbi:MAG: tRNA lysidine(34) synthetase TilS [Clostridia bacterium]